MRNLKKFLALVLAMLMVVSAAATVSAFDDVADDNQYADAIYALVDMGVITGRTADTFAPEENVTRWMMALMMARALNPEAPATMWSEGLKIFSDVEGAHQYPGAIAWARTNGIVTGIGGDLFAPESGIKYQDALIMAVRALGYTVDVSGTPYWLDAYAQALALGLTANITGVEGEDALTRAETAQILYNMLYAPTADGESYAALLYGEATATNVTPFIVVGTTEQYAAEGLNIVDGGYVALQEVINGIPAGDIIEVPVEELGVAAADIESVFCNYYNLVNYTDAGTYDDIILAGTYDVIDNNDVTVDSGKTKLTIGGKIYYPVDEKTGSAVKNEIVIFNTTEGGAAQQELYTTADGDIIFNGKIVATAVYSLSGEIVAYAPVDPDADDLDYYTVDAAKAKWGQIVEGSAALFATMTANQLATFANAYQLIIYNDITADGDTLYDRAYFSPIYMSVYNTSYKADDDVKIVSGAFASTLEDVTINGEVGKGDVFAYTFNKQLNQIDVIGVANQLTGTIDKINTSNIKATPSKVVFTIDGKDYTLAHAGFEKAMGADLAEANVAELAATVADRYEKIASKNAIKYSYDPAVETSWLDLAVVDSLIKFYEYNGYIIFAQTYTIEESYDLAIVEELNDWDDEVLYMDLYIDGEIVEDVPVAKISDAEKEVYTIANLTSNDLKFSKFISSNEDLFEKGNIVRIVELADGNYQLSEYLTAGNEGDFGLSMIGKDNNNSGIVIFDDGIADTYKKRDGSIGEVKSELVLRTTDSTKFFFLEVTEKGIKSIKVVEGADDKSTLNLANLTIYADKIGYTGAAKGTATEVYVFYTDAADITGFGITSVVDTYVIHIETSATTDLKKYTLDLGSDLGITGDYADKYLYAYGSAVEAINMHTGASVSNLVSASKLTAGGFYEVSTDGVIIGAYTGNDLVSAQVVGKALDTPAVDATLDLDRRYVILKKTNGDDIVSSADEVSAVKFTAAKEQDIKSDASAFTAGATATIKYLTGDLDDGIFVAVITDGGKAPTVVTGDPDAVTATEGATLTGAAGTVYDLKVTRGETLADVKVQLLNESDHVIETSKNYTENTLALYDATNGAVEGATITVKVEDGAIIINVTVLNNLGLPTAFKLVNGETYRLAGNITDVAADYTATLEYVFTYTK